MWYKLITADPTCIKEPTAHDYTTHMLVKIKRAVNFGKRKSKKNPSFKLVQCQNMQYSLQLQHSFTVK